MIIVGYLFFVVVFFCIKVFVVVFGYVGEEFVFILCFVFVWLKYRVNIWVFVGSFGFKLGCFYFGIRGGKDVGNSGEDKVEGGGFYVWIVEV